MTDSWEDRVAAFWETADSGRPDAAIETMRGLVDERPPGDADALYEWASVHDFVGREAEAVSLYRAALRGGLTNDRHAQAVVQLASSLRNTGEPEAAIELLAQLPPDATVGAAVDAFMALALHDAGRVDDALRIALRALAQTLPRYGDAVLSYADELTGPGNDRHPQGGNS